MTDTRNIRNIALIGHSGNGKTTLAEAMLYLSGATDRFGKTADGNTVCDFDAEEIKRKFSISAAVAPVQWKEIKINLIDAPGYPDFEAEVDQALRVADIALILADANSRDGVHAGMDIAWQKATEAGIPKAIFVNKVDDDNANFKKTFNKLREKFGVSVCPVLVPLIVDSKVVAYADLLEHKAFIYDAKNGQSSECEFPAEAEEDAAKYADMIAESLAGTSDEMMEKYFAGERFTFEESIAALSKGILDGTIVPVMSGAASRVQAVTSLCYHIKHFFPSPLDHKQSTADGEKHDTDVSGDPSIFIFKTVMDPFVGRINYFRVMSGTVKRDMTLKSSVDGHTEKLAHIYVPCGKKQTEVEELVCGDIGITTKLNDAETNDTFYLSKPVEYEKIEFPKPYSYRAIVPKAKGDEDKISGGISKLLEEDRSLRFENNAETHQLLIYGMGDTHLDVLTSKLKTRYSTEVTLTEPRIAYRETIKKSVKVQGKFKKQSGGHGQYGDVWIEFSPGEEDGLTFTESTVGGSVPKSFHPAVEKGLEECMKEGILAGYPVVKLRANLYDGSYHDVDSSEMSFKLAARVAYKDGLPKACPIILEPIGKLYVTIPDSLMGDVIGDLNKRRGRVNGMNHVEHRPGYSVIDADVPVSEMMDFPVALRAMSQGIAKFTFDFDRYEEAPAPVAQKIIESAPKNAE